MGPGPIIIGYDGSPAAQRAIEEAGALMTGHRALVVCVHEADAAFELVEVPTLPPAPLDVRAAVEIDRVLYERARLVARQGAQLAEKAGLEADPLVVADVLTAAETLVRLAKEREAQAMVVGTQRKLGLRDVLLGSTAREVIKSSPAPVIVVRAHEDAKPDER